MSEWQHVTKSGSGAMRVGAMEQLSAAEKMAYWAFHQRRRPGYLERAYLELGSDADAEEAVDRAFVYFENNWGRMMQMAKADAYAWTALKHEIASQFRRRRTRAAPYDSAPFEAAGARDDPLALLPDAMALFAAVRRLPERQRDAYCWVRCLGYSTEDAAEIMGVATSTVRSHLRQATTRLVRILTDDATHDEGETPQ